MRETLFLFALAGFAFSLTRVSRETWHALSLLLRSARRLVLDMAHQTQAMAANKLMRRRMAYRHVFQSDKGELTPAAKLVLLDLARFGRVLTSTSVVSPVTKSIDPIASALAEGRREMALKIFKELNVDIGDLFALVKEEETYG